MLWVGWLQALTVTCYVVTVHRPLSGLLYTHELLHVTIYMRTIYIHSYSCINCHCTGVLSNVRTITALWSKHMYLHGYQHWMLWQTCFDTFISVACSWTCSHYTTLLNPLWYWYCKFSVYEPLLQWICWTHTYLINIRLDIIWLEMLKENMSTWEGIDMRKANSEGTYNNDTTNLLYLLLLDRPLNSQMP